MSTAQGWAEDGIDSHVHFFQFIHKYIRESKIDRKEYRACDA
jgi:hypothetical protein